MSSIMSISPSDSVGSAWKLPSGKPLAEFALEAGFLAPRLLGNPQPASRFGKGN